MINKKQNRLFLFAHKIFYDDVSRKINGTSFKNIMDFVYVIFEKIAINFEFLFQKYVYMYGELVEKEVKASNITKNDSVLVIGCGSIPSTSILISKLSNAKKVVSIDHDANAIKNAIDLVESNNLGNNLKFEYANGFKYPIKNFDVIFILYGIKKQKEILKHVSNNMNTNSSIVFRTTLKSLNNIYGGKDFLKKDFEISEIISSQSLGDTVSFVLKKK